MQLKKRTKVILFLISIVAITIISAILAYLTDKATRDNQFTIGSIEIDLVEESWENLAPEEDLNENGIPDVAEALGPNESVAKDPKVQNIGDNDAYVYLRVVVPKGEVGIDDGDPEMQELFSYEINEDHWVPMDSLTIDGEDYVTYTYYYKKGEDDYILNPGDETETLFDEVILANITDFNGLDLTQQIIVKAYAIQTDDEIDVENNKWIAEFEKELAGNPVMLEAKVMSMPASEEAGYQNGEDFIVGIPFSSNVYATSSKTAINSSNAPVLKGQIGNGTPFNLDFVEVTVGSIEKTESLAISSRASGGSKGAILKYKHTIQNGEKGKFKIVSFTGSIYDENANEVALETPIIPKSEENKAAIMPSLYSQIQVSNYGEKIKGLEDYRIFYKDEEKNEIVLIYSKGNGYLPNAKIPAEACMVKSKVTSSYPDGTPEGIYRAFWLRKGEGVVVNNRTEAIEKLKVPQWSTALLPKSLINKGIRAEGGVDLVTWVNSWNQTNPTEKIYKKYTENSVNNVPGWLVSKDVSSDETVPNNATYVTISNTNNLYFPGNENIEDPNSNFSIFGYWLASPSASYASDLMGVDCNGYVYSDGYGDDDLAVRPAVYIPANIKGFYNTETEMWEIE